MPEKKDDTKDLRDKESSKSEEPAHKEGGKADALVIAKPAEMTEPDRSARAEAARKRGESDPDQPAFSKQEDARRQKEVERMLQTEVPEDKPVVQLTVRDLLRRRQTLEDFIFGRAGDSLADRRKYAQAEIDGIDQQLDKAGFSIVHGNAVPHGSTFNERTGLINDPGKPGDRIYSKKDGWVKSEG